jgi:hypothetical protein
MLPSIKPKRRNSGDVLKLSKMIDLSMDGIEIKARHVKVAEEQLDVPFENNGF